MTGSDLGDQPDGLATYRVIDPLCNVPLPTPGRNGLPAGLTWRYAVAAPRYAVAYHGG
jgi:hypothetical protein